MNFIDYFLPYNNFIVIISIIILNIFLLAKRSYWQTFLIGNGLLLAILGLIGFNPVQTFSSIVQTMIDFIVDILNEIL